MASCGELRRRRYGLSPKGGQHAWLLEQPLWQPGLRPTRLAPREKALARMNGSHHSLVAGEPRHLGRVRAGWAERPNAREGEELPRQPHDAAPGVHAVLDEREVVGHRLDVLHDGAQRATSSHDGAQDLGRRPHQDAPQVAGHGGPLLYPNCELLRVDTQGLAALSQQDQIGAGTREQHGVRKYVDEGTYERKRDPRGDLVDGQPLRSEATGLESAAHELVEVARVQRGDAGVGDRWWLHRHQVVALLGLRSQMMTAVVGTWAKARM